VSSEVCGVVGAFTSAFGHGQLLFLAGVCDFGFGFFSDAHFGQAGWPAGAVSFSGGAVAQQHGRGPHRAAVR
jgi:hypothetical protein